MPQINLLPWREELRKKRQQEFLIALGGALVAAVAVIGLSNFVFSQMISKQDERNTRLTNEITLLQKSIVEIDGLEKQKERLLARMEIIERLQGSRPEIVHLFDEMVRQLPEGVYLTGLKQAGKNLELKGAAESSTRVSALLRRMDSSEYLTDPDVVKVETANRGAGRQSSFVVTAKQISQIDETEDAG